MGAAGVAWGVYSLRGRGTARPIAVTAGNFLRSVPFALAVSALAALGRNAHARPQGIVLALVSGGVTSGLGYVLWYAALRGLTATRAATVQLAVPVLTGFGGALLLDETVTLRLVLAAVLILGGVAVAVRGKQWSRRAARPRAARRSGRL
jgi:drug/metabolite transporter (DMT)-like permease